MWLIITLLIWASSYYAETEAKRDFIIELYEYRINTTNSSYVKTLKYNLYAQKYISIEFSLKRTVNEIYVHNKIDMLKKDNKPINVMNIVVDDCKALEAAYKTPLVIVVTKEVFRKSNVPKKCPIKPNELFYIRNFTFNEEYFPKFAPLVTFQTFTEIYSEKQYQGYVTARGTIIKK